MTPISGPGCEYQFGLYPASDVCSTNYIKCIHGHPHDAQCDAGLVYDPKTRTCVWPDQLLPYCNPDEIVGFKCPHKVPSHSPAAKFWPFPRYVPQITSISCNPFGVVITFILHARETPMGVQGVRRINGVISAPHMATV